MIGSVKRSPFWRRVVVTAFALPSAACNGDSPAEATPTPDRDSARVAWLGTHTARVRSADPADRDWSDLEPLRAAIGNARVVMLGEATHGDGDTFLAKTRLIMFLHEELGFDLLVFECGLFPTSKAWEALRAGAPVREALASAIYPVWMGSREVQPLFEYVEARRSTARPLEVAGMDPQLWGTATADHFVADLEDVLRRGQADVLTASDWPEFRRLLQDAVTGVWWYEKPSPDEKAAFDAAYGNVESTLAGGLPLVSADEVAFWRQVLRSTRIDLENDIAIDPDVGYRIEQRIARDEQMGENLVWLATTRYPSAKIVVWAANYHILRNVSDVALLGHPGYYSGVTTMGDVVHVALGDDVYILGFTARAGEWGYWYSGYDPTPLSPTPVGSLESLLYEAGVERGFLNLRVASGNGAWLREQFVARPTGYLDANAPWRQVMDGVFFTDRMTRSTPSGWVTTSGAGAGASPSQSFVTRSRASHE
jgi:erythromycin esterase